MSINLEKLKVIVEFGKNDIYETLIALNEQENEEFFIKKTSKSILENPIKIKYFENEVNINQYLDHDNIIKFYEKKDILNDSYLIFEVANGGNINDNLKKYIDKNKKPFSEEIVQIIIKQVASAIKYLHDAHIIFRNLALEHILVDYDSVEDRANLNFSNAKIKIANFHFSKILEDNELAHSFIGIPVYMDPNISFYNNEPDKISYEYKADIWSLGSVCFELLTGISPFDGNDFEELIKNMKTGKYKISKSLNLSNEVISFISGMLQYDPKKRFDINDVLNHDFLKKNVKEFSHKGQEKFGEVKGNDIILNININ
jgi:serine/threonine protein kinase